MLIQGAKIKDLKGSVVEIEIPLHKLDYIKKLKPNDLVSVEIKRPKDKRTLKQNAYIWEIIHQIDLKVNGFNSDEFSIYKQLVKEAKVKSVYIQTVEGAKKDLENLFRYVEEVERRTTDKGESILYRCYYGTSKFTKEEMARFIDVLIDRAYKEDIDVYNYEEVLRR